MKSQRSIYCADRIDSLFVKLSVCLLAVLCISFLPSAGFGQRIEHYNSPLYSSKPYDPNRITDNGLPKALSEVGIQQKLNDQLPLDTEFKNEAGHNVKLGSFFGKRPVVLALVYYECPDALQRSSERIDRFGKRYFA